MVIGNFLEYDFCTPPSPQKMCTHVNAKMDSSDNFKTKMLLVIF